MRVERASVDQVREKINSLKRKSSDNSDATQQKSAIDQYDEKCENQALEEEKRKKLKKERDIALKKEKEALEMQDVDPEMAALMGFGGFK